MNDALFIIDRPPAHFTDNPVREGGETVVIAAVAMLMDPFAQANANLIAAAPELLAAFKDLVERFVKCAVLAGTDKEFAEASVASYRSLIAKAEARS